MTVEPTVFIVDDDEAIRESVGALLESKGYAAETFESAESFLADYRPGDVGCLLLDVRMPGMDGLSLQENLLARGDGLPVIIITGYGDVTMAVRAMKAGAVDFLEKPFRQKDLLAAVRHALATEPGGADPAEAAEAAARFETLTAREREVVGLLIAGRVNKQIAEDLGISPRTVEVHRARAMQKSEVGSLAELVRLALAAGLENGWSHRTAETPRSSGSVTA